MRFIPGLLLLAGAGTGSRIENDGGKGRLPVVPSPVFDKAPSFTDFGKFREWLSANYPPVSIEREDEVEVGQLRGRSHSSQIFRDGSGGGEFGMIDRIQLSSPFGSREDMADFMGPMISKSPDEVFSSGSVRSILELVGGRDEQVNSCMMEVAGAVDLINGGEDFHFSLSMGANIERCLAEHLDSRIYRLSFDSMGQDQLESSAVSSSAAGGGDLVDQDDSGSHSSLSSSEGASIFADNEDNFYGMLFILRAPPAALTLEYVRVSWFTISRKLRQEISKSIFDQERLPPVSTWPDARIGVQTLLPAYHLTWLASLSTQQEAAFVTDYPRDWMMYHNDYYLTSGPRWFDQIKFVEEYVARYISELSWALDLPVDPYQFDAATYLTRFVNSPALYIASLMPEVDVDPVASLYLTQQSPQSKPTLSWDEISDILGAFRRQWPPEEVVDSGANFFDVECLLVRMIALSRYPIDLAMATFDNADGVDRRALIPEMPLKQYDEFQQCLERTKHTDMVALPMMIYHVLSEVHEGFDYKALYPLLGLIKSNLNWTELDQAAKMRAATAIVKPSWWLKWNSITNTRSLPSLKDLFRDEVGVSGNAEFDSLVSISLSDLDLGRRYVALRSSGWVQHAEEAAETSPGIKTALRLLEIIIGPIQVNGDFRVLNQWTFVIKKYLTEYNGLIANAGRVSDEERLSQATDFVKRARAVQSVARLHPRDISESDDSGLSQAFIPVLNRLFGEDLLLDPAALGHFYLHFIQPSVQEEGIDAFLADVTFGRIISNLREKLRPLIIE